MVLAKIEEALVMNILAHQEGDEAVELDLGHIKDKSISNEVQHMVRMSSPQKTIECNVEMGIILKDEDPVFELNLKCFTKYCSLIINTLSLQNLVASSLSNNNFKNFI